MSDKFTAGTEIILTLKDNTDTENYDEYLETYTLKQLIKKYSDYVRYPIGMMVETTHKKEDSDEYETVMEHQIINSMIPLWKRNKKDVSEEEYNDFYVGQLEELLTNYGDVYECWWDGAGSTEAVYDWERWAKIIRENQKDCNREY